jgi:hypothetical protein
VAGTLTLGWFVPSESSIPTTGPPRCTSPGGRSSVLLADGGEAAGKADYRNARVGHGLGFEQAWLAEFEPDHPLGREGDAEELPRARYG